MTDKKYSDGVVMGTLFSLIGVLLMQLIIAFSYGG